MFEAAIQSVDQSPSLEAHSSKDVGCAQVRKKFTWVNY